MQKLMVGLAVALLIGSTGCTMNQRLHVPAGEGNLAKVQAEIGKGMNVDSKDAAGQTALMYAAESGRLDVVKYLIEQGANVNTESGNLGRGTALIYASANNRLETMTYLLDHGADINATTFHRETALFWAAAMGHKEAVTLLLSRNANKEIKNKDGQSVLDVAKKVNREDICKILSGTK